MAKQRGIHQIKGKINNLCYYEQKYVRGGLIRRINEAMSERLKTDPAFERTRFSNTIFGACSIMARFILSYFGNRSTFLFIPYRQAVLTKLLLKNYLRYESDSAYPQVYFPSRIKSSLELTLDEIIKNKLSIDFAEIPRMLSISLDSESVFYSLSSNSLENYLEKYGGVAVRVSISPPHYLYHMSYDTSTGKYITPNGNPGGRGTEYIWEPGDGDLDIEFFNPDTDDAYSFWIIYITPLASQIGGRYISKNTGSTCGMIQTNYFS